MINIHSLKHNYTLLRRISIKKRLAILLSVQIVIVLAGLFLVLQTSFQDTLSLIKMNNAMLVNSLGGDLDNTISDLESVTMFPIIRTASSISSVTYDYLSEPEKNSSIAFDADFKRQCHSMFYLYPKVTLITILNNDGAGPSLRSDLNYAYSNPISGKVYDTPNQADEKWFTETLSYRGKILFWNQSDFKSLLNQPPPNKNWLYATRSIYNFEQHRNVGTIVASVDMSSGVNLYNNNRNFEEEKFALFDKNNSYVLGNLENSEKDKFAIETLPFVHEQTVYKTISTDEGTMLYTLLQTSSGNSLYIKTPYKMIYFTAIRERLALCIVMLLFVTLIIIFTNVVVSSVTHPIAKLVSACNKLKNGNFSTSIADFSHDELSDFASSFNSMSREIERLINEVYEKDLLKSQIEIQMLREQINPHFLYNTLDSIRSAAALKNEPELSQMAYLLAKNLRYGISKVTQIVTVDEELNSLRDYIALQQIRYGDKIKFEIHVDAATLSLKINKMLLQPIVENALYHGIAPATRHGTITILGFHEHSVLTFQVIDDGVGMSDKEIMELTDYIDGKNDNFTSIGLKNINRRIKLYYGEQYGLVLRSSPNHGTIVTLTAKAVE